MKGIDQQWEQRLRDVPEIPFSERLRWDILEAAHDLSVDRTPLSSTRRKSHKRWNPFAASFAGVAVAALVVAGVLQPGVLRGHSAVTTASIPSSEVGLKPAQVKVLTHTWKLISGQTDPTIYATVQNASNHAITKYNTFAVLWLGGTDTNPLSGDSLVIANGPGTPLSGKPIPDDNGPLQPGQIAHWEFHLDVTNSAEYVKQGVHLKFFQAGASSSHMQPPFVTWPRAPLKARFISSGLTHLTPEQQWQYQYKIVNTGKTSIDLRQVWGIDWFEDPSQSNQNWDDEKVTRFADIPHLTHNESPILGPGKTCEVYFTWIIPKSIEAISTEKPQVFFVQR